jgi:LysM repeat protein
MSAAAAGASVAPATGGGTNARRVLGVAVGAAVARLAMAIGVKHAINQADKFGKLAQAAGVTVNQQEY